MLINVAEAVQVLFNCHDMQKKECEGRFGKSFRYDDCMIVKSDLFEDTFKIKSQSDGFVVYIDGFGFFGKTVEAAIHDYYKHVGTPTFNFKIGE
jgi:hypothetical protein